MTPIFGIRAENCGSALRQADRSEAALARFLVLALHVVAGAFHHLDHAVQRDQVARAGVQRELLKMLDRLKLADNTLVLFSSDNGPEVTTTINMRSDHGHDGARPWRGMKRDQWEGGHRVPFIARWPGKIEPGSTSAQTLSLTDVMATCAAIVGADLPSGAAEDSYDMLPVLLGDQGDTPVRRYTLQQTISLALSIRRGPWKYLDHRGSGGNNYSRGQLREFALPEMAPEASGQLYNLDDDPGETNNLFFKHPEIVKELKAKLEEFKESGRSAPLPERER